MISWGTIVYGAVLSAVAAVVLVFASRRDRRFDVLAAVAISGFLGPFLWNATLHRIEAREFFVDAPIAVNAGQLAGHGLRRLRCCRRRAGPGVRSDPQRAGASR